MRFVLPLFLVAGFASAQTVSPTTIHLGEEIIQGISESTARYIPQIQDRRMSFGLQSPENPLLHIPTDPAGPNNLPVGGRLKDPRGSVLARFPGLSETGLLPADPTVACGPTMLVATTNSNIAFYGKSGTQAFLVDLNTFFQGVSNSTRTVFDPKVCYDTLAQRFVLVALDMNTSSNISSLLFAISDDSDPTGTWHKYRIEASAVIGGVNSFGDYPGLAINKDGYGVLLNMFGFSNQAFKGTQIVTIMKSSVLSGGAGTVNRFTDSSFAGVSRQGAEGLNTTSTKIFFVNAPNSNTVRLWEMGGLDATPTIPTSQDITVPSFVQGNYQAPSTNGRTLSALDTRLLNAVYRGTSLVTTHAVKVTGDTRMRARWYELTVPPFGGPATLVQTGEVREETAADMHYFMPAISKNAAGDIAMVLTKCSSAGPTADVMQASRKASDPPGTMGAPVHIKSSQTATYGHTTNNRWGDYAGVSVDPADQGSFWMVHMTGGATYPTRPIWITEIAKVGVSPVVTGMAFPSGPDEAPGGSGPHTVSVTTNTSAPGPSSIALSSANSTLLSVPASVTLPGGATSVDFTSGFNTGVDVDTPVAVIATLNGVSFSKTFTVRPADLADLILSYSTIAANQSVIATILLNGKAGPSGRLVALGSSDPIAVVQPSVTILSGARSGRFGISTGNTNAIRTSNISATLGGTVIRTLTVIPPPPLTTFAIAGNNTVKGGLNIGCTAGIASAAPVGGVRIKLSESSAFVTPTTYLHVVEGAQLGSTTIQTSPVTTTQTVPIIARLNGVSRTDTLTVVP